MSRTGTAARLFGHVEEALLGMNADDMRRRRLLDGQLVKVKSRRGSLILPIQKDDSLRAGQTFLPMHWGDRFLKGLGSNVLTLRSEEHTSELQSLMRNSYAVFCLKKKTKQN